MKELIVALISFTLGYFTAVTDVHAQTTAIYGPNGQYVGQTFQNGNTTSFYGPTGQYQGQAFRNGNSTSLYGPTGQYQGQTFSNTPTAPIIIAPPTQSLTPMFDSVFGR
jgi:glutamate synthase domain-containing protein 3